jgi:hypothetical protein
MAIINQKVSIAATSTNPNIFSGSAFEFPPRHSKIDFGIVAEPTAGGADPGLTCRIQFGSQIIAESMAIPVGSPSAGTAQVKAPVIPDELVVRDVAIGGSRLVCAVTNPSGAAVNVRFLVNITPLH